MSNGPSPALLQLFTQKAEKGNLKLLFLFSIRDSMEGNRSFNTPVSLLVARFSVPAYAACGAAQIGWAYPGGRALDLSIQGVLGQLVCTLLAM